MKGSSSIGNHIKEQHGTVPSDIYRDFKILKKCQSKFDCLIYEMLFIKENFEQTVRFNPCEVIYIVLVFYHLRFSVLTNSHADSIRAKSFI